MKETLNLSLRLALICAVAALALSQVASLTAGPIAAAEYAAKMKAVLAVLPEFDNQPDQDALILDEGEPGERTYYRAFLGGQPAGYAFRGVTQLGYSGEIEVMIGVDMGGSVQALRILRHAETPGLGANYAAPELLGRLFAGKALAGTQWKVKKDGGDVDAVTGATVTARALADAVQRALQQFEDDQLLLAQATEVDA